MRARLLLVLMLAAAGCRPGGSGDGLTEDQFITVITELRRAAQRAGADTSAFAVEREEILARHGVTEAELLAFVESPDRDLRELAEVWDSVGTGLNTEEPTH